MDNFYLIKISVSLQHQTPRSLAQQELSPHVLSCPNLSSAVLTTTICRMQRETQHSEATWATCGPRLLLTQPVSSLATCPSSCSPLAFGAGAPQLMGGAGPSPGLATAHTSMASEEGGRAACRPRFVCFGLAALSESPGLRKGIAKY